METTFREIPVGTQFKVTKVTAPSPESLMELLGWDEGVVKDLDLPWCLRFYRVNRRGHYTFLPFGVEDGVVLRKVSQTSVKFPDRGCHWVVGSYSVKSNNSDVVWYDLRDHMVVEVVTALK